MSNSRSIPILPTVIVALACLTMIALGIWQLGRAEEKDVLLARYAAAGDISDEVVFPATEDQVAERLYRRSTVECVRVAAMNSRAGTSANGVKGWAHYADCLLAGGARADVAIGFSRRPEAPAWSGGTVSGWIGPGPRLVAAEPVAGLERLARPDPANLPDNHLAYAGQWFFFALTALVIYLLALRRRWRDQD